jgi:hypothetical protein
VSWTIPPSPLPRSRGFTLAGVQRSASNPALLVYGRGTIAYSKVAFPQTPPRPHPTTATTHPPGEPKNLDVVIQTCPSETSMYHSAACSVSPGVDCGGEDPAAARSTRDSPVKPLSLTSYCALLAGLRISFSASVCFRACTCPRGNHLPGFQATTKRAASP